MSKSNEVALDNLLDMMTEKSASKLSQQSSGMNPRLLTIEQGAAYLGCALEIVQHLVSAGKVPTVRSDRRVFLDRQDLDKWIDDDKTGWV